MQACLNLHCSNPVGEEMCILSDIATFCVRIVKVLMRLYICAGLSESPLQQPSGPRDVCFCLTLLLSVCDQ